MTDELTIEKKKPGPQPKPKIEFEDFQALVAKVNALEKVLAKVAHNAGNPNSLMTDNGLTPHNLQASDLRKYN